ncbi:ABC transporter substrate-binding protein [Streptomyces sp. HNM0574]|uniref:ABC transporter substrate-binding protein n=1 Tax=Streptomyces sp. HNM0574 TaxID=2714954 RepID=UPI00146E4E4A|nr:ABC transporter substrate-binding protein [Streptomyces sp. HNM0574]NLU67196.1 ABC transporter substrate-binding protein [Streptomyces sp. HNM0574]
MTAPIRRRPLAVAPVALAVTGALLVTLTGCGDQTDAAQARRAQDRGEGPPLADKLPQKIRDQGVVKVGSDAAYRPMEYQDGADIVGVDPEIAQAVGKKLGVRFQFQNGTFDGLITAMQTGRFDMAMSSMSDTKERQQGLDDNGKKAGKGVDFVDYLSSGSSILVRKGNPDKVDSVEEMCGKKVATQRGTVSHDILKDRTKQCEKDGKKPVTVEAYETDDQARIRLKTGAVVADVADFPVAAHAAASGNEFEVVGEQMESAPYGMAFAKDNSELRDAVRAGLQAIIEDGTYAKILKKWGIEDGAVSEAKINGGS